jgi:hypothetical protein
MAPKSNKEKEKEKERKTVCVGCKKNFTKSDYCVICGSCSYWYHKTCAGMSEDVFKCVDQHYKDNGSTFWNCQPCATYAKGITAKLREMEGRLEVVEKNQEEQDEKIEDIEKEVANISKELKKKEEKVEEIVENKEKSVYEEIREREMRKKNVILHGVGELQAQRPTWEERTKWDRQSCVNVFEAIELDINTNDIKFTKRIGERGEGPRPLLAGFFTEKEKISVLKNAKRLDSTQFKEVNIAPDLTRRQREEEKELKKVAEERNRNLAETDLAKNLHWTVVGARGEKRLEKRLKEMPERGKEHRRGGRTEARDRRPLTGANRTVVEHRSRKEKVSPAEKDKEAEEEESSSMDTEEEQEGREEEMETGTRQKTTKRKERSKGSVSDSPPEKR